MLHKLRIMFGNIIKNDSILYTVHKEKMVESKESYHKMGQYRHEAN